MYFVYATPERVMVVWIKERRHRVKSDGHCKNERRVVMRDSPWARITCFDGDDEVREGIREEGGVSMRKEVATQAEVRGRAPQFGTRYRPGTRR